MESFLESLPLRDPDFAIQTLRAGAHANRTASCRRASIDQIHPPWRLIATGDLHDNPLSLLRLCALAGLGLVDPPPDAPPPSHLTLHEIIHPSLEDGQTDLSHRALIRVAALKARHPEFVHTLLANHELAQIVGAGIIKDGVNVVQAFNEGVDSVYAHRAPDVQDAIAEFIRSMPLALRASFAGASQPASAGILPTRVSGTTEFGPDGPGTRRADELNSNDHGAGIASADLLLAHSLPSPDCVARFDSSILDRDIRDEDLVPRQGSAHMLVWGRSHTTEQIETLARDWGVGVFILGHEKSPTGAHAVSPRALVLNSDHHQAKCVIVSSDCPPASAMQVLDRVIPLSGHLPSPD